MERIRTPDQLVRSQLLYPTELPSHIQHKYISTRLVKNQIYFSPIKAFYLQKCVGKNKKTSKYIRCFSGGDDGIRTHARVTPTNGLANRPLEPLEYISIFIIKWRKERDSNPWYGHPYAGFQDRCLKPTRPSFHV